MGHRGLVNTHHRRSEVPALRVLRTWPSKPEELGPKGNARPVAPAAHSRPSQQRAETTGGALAMLIAATALAEGLPLYTRDGKDFGCSTA